MKIGFSFTKKAEVRKKVGVQLVDDSGPKAEIIKDITNGEITPQTPVVDAGPLIIPCLNPLKIKRKRADNYEEEAKRRKELTAKLDLLSPEDREAALALMADPNEEEEEDDDTQPIMMQSKFHTVRGDLGLSDKEMLRKEQDLLPDAKKDQFENIPVEKFGLALLRGMGYDPKTDENKPIILERREGISGLGASTLLPGQKDVLPGEKAKDQPPVARRVNPATSSTAKPRILLGYQKPEPGSETGVQPIVKEPVKEEEQEPVKEEEEMPWASRGLLVRIKKDEWRGCTAVVLKEENGQVKVKVRRGDGPSEVLEGLTHNELEKVVDRETKKVRIVAGNMTGEEGEIVRRVRDRVFVKIREGEEEECYTLNQVCACM